VQQVEGVTVRHWRGQDGEFAASRYSRHRDRILRRRMPPGYMAAMAQCEPRPVWINYEGLSAEEWVEGCHTLPSMHPRLKLTKHFFFPGFNGKTGGLLREARPAGAARRLPGRPGRQAAFPGRPRRDAGRDARSLKVSLFCYPDAPVAALFAAWSAGGASRDLPGAGRRGAEQVAAFLGADAAAGAASRAAR
jgi:uncharacterized repeat protein (TIGR03837 family)